jgi:hypothetical protein
VNTLEHTEGNRTGRGHSYQYGGRYPQYEGVSRVGAA